MYWVDVFRLNHWHSESVFFVEEQLRYSWNLFFICFYLFDPHNSNNMLSTLVCIRWTYCICQLLFYGCRFCVWTYYWFWTKYLCFVFYATSNHPKHCHQNYASQSRKLLRANTTTNMKRTLQTSRLKAGTTKIYTHRLKTMKK